MSTDDQLKQIYQQYKAFLIPIVIMYVCLIVFFQVILPQFQSWLALESQITSDRHRLTVMVRNLNYITRIDNKTVDSNLALSVAALPSEKDFIGILSSIARASVATGVSIGDYSFSNEALQTNGNKTLKAILTLNGSYDTVKHFITALKNELPLADIGEAHLSASGSTISILFFYKDFPHISFHDDQPIQGLNAHEQQILQKLQGFDHSTSDTNDITVPESN